MAAPIRIFCQKPTFTQERALGGIGSVRDIPRDQIANTSSSEQIKGGLVHLRLKYSVSAFALLAAMNTASLAESEFNVRSFGAKGNGATDDTAAEQAAINAAPAGHTVVWPRTASCFKTTSPLTINKPLTLRGPGAICMTTTNAALLSISSSNIMVDGLTLVGPQHAAYHDGERAIHVSGTFNAGKAPSKISNVTIKNTTINGWGGYGISASYIEGFHFTKNKITNVGFAGIGGISIENGTISGNTVQSITASGLPSANAYGIFLSRATGDDGELVSQPRSSNVRVASNSVRTVPTWECYDTHGGKDITFTRNTGYGCRVGLGIGASTNHSGVYAYAPLNVASIGTVVDSGVTDGSYGYGIVFQGVIGGEHATGSMTGGSVSNYGASTNGSTGSALFIYGTSGLTVADVSILYPSPIGVLLSGDNCGTSLTGLSIVDPWTNAAGVGEAEGIYTRGSNNDVTLDGNTILHVDKTARYLITTASGAAVRLSGAAGDNARLGFNRSNATKSLINIASTVSHAANISPRAVSCPTRPPTDHLVE